MEKHTMERESEEKVADTMKAYANNILCII